MFFRNSLLSAEFAGDIFHSCFRIFSHTLGLQLPVDLRDPDVVMNRANLLRPDVPVRLPYVQVGVVILSLCLPESQKLP